MTDEQRRMIERLSKCRFGVGSADKRFVADMFARTRIAPDAELTPRQDWYLRRTFYRYRRQLGDMEMKIPPDYHEAPASTKPVVETTVKEQANGDIIVCRKRGTPDAQLAAELARLAEWNEGRKRQA
jgi:hypothetical protein